MSIQIHANNTISIDNMTVARIGKNANLYGRGKFTTIYTGEADSFSKPHKIKPSIYVGGPSRWIVNPEFETAVRATLKSYH